MHTVSPTLQGAKLQYALEMASQLWVSVPKSAEATYLPMPIMASVQARWKVQNAEDTVWCIERKNDK